MQQLIEFRDEVHVALQRLAQHRARLEFRQGFDRLLAAIDHDRSRHQRSRPLMPEHVAPHEHHAFHRASQGRLHLQRPPEHVVQHLDRVQVVASHHDLRPRLQLHLEPRDHAEEAGPGAARGPEQIGVLPLVGTHELTICRDHIDRRHACAGGPPQTRVPAKAALQEEAPKPHRHAVAGREKQAMLAQSAIEVGSLQRRLQAGAPAVDVDRETGHGGKVDQHSAFAQERGGPAVPARTDGDFQIALPRQPYRGHHVVVVSRPHDDVGITRRHAPVPHGPTQLFVPGIATPDHGSVRVLISKACKCHDASPLDRATASESAPTLGPSRQMCLMHL